MKSWWKGRPKLSLALSEKMEVFSRHCFSSSISRHKERLPGYTPRRAYENLLTTLDKTEANLTFILDTQGKEGSHFLLEQTIHPVISVSAGSESASFLCLLDYLQSLPLSPTTLLYFVEEDYLHRPGWSRVLKEPFAIPGVDYATLYDHRDKYDPSLYPRVSSRIFVTSSCHWRETPSTTQTFAVRWGTLTHDAPLHRRYSKPGAITRDHTKFCHLRRKGALLVSALPGYATHCEPRFASPCIEWDRFQSTHPPGDGTIGRR